MIPLCADVLASSLMLILKIKFLKLRLRYKHDGRNGLGSNHFTLPVREVDITLNTECSIGNLSATSVALFYRISYRQGEHKAENPAEDDMMSLPL